MKTKTMLFATAFLLSVSFNGLNAQTDEEIINEILVDLFDENIFGCQGDTILMLNEAVKVHHIWIDSFLIEMESGFRIPSKIFSEWGKKENQEDGKIWNEYYLNKRDTIFLASGTPCILQKPVLKLLSSDDIDQMLAQTKERQYIIYAISQILFDDSGENAILKITPFWRGKWAFSQPIIIKKIFGKWVVIHRSSHY